MKGLKFIFALLLPLALVACGKFKEADLGFPHTVKFSKEGGEQVVTNANGETFATAEIHDYKSGEQGEVSRLEDGTHCNTFKWLQVEYQPHTQELKIIAEPNNSVSRKLHIELYSGYEYHTIEVFQEASHLLE